VLPPGGDRSLWIFRLRGQQASRQRPGQRTRHTGKQRGAGIVFSFSISSKVESYAVNASALEFEMSVHNCSAPGSVSCSKVARLLPQYRTGSKDYNGHVRHYTTKAMNGGTTFKCTFCEHSVTTLDFNSMNGNRRTQAAAVINQHVSSLHVRTLAPIKLGSRGAL